MTTWIAVCKVHDVEPEDVLRFDRDGATYCLYRGPDGSFHASDGLCTHEHVHLSDGLVIDFRIECPKHGGQFDIRTGEALRSPACGRLRTYPVRVRDGTVQVGLD